MGGAPSRFRPLIAGGLSRSDRPHLLTALSTSAATDAGEVAGVLLERGVDGVLAA